MFTFNEEFKAIEVKDFDVNKIYDQTIEKNDKIEAASVRCREFGEHLLHTAEEQFKAIAKRSRKIEYGEGTKQCYLKIPSHNPIPDIAFFKLNATPNGGIRINMKKTSINISPEDYLNLSGIEKLEINTKNTVIDMIIDAAKAAANYDWKNQNG